MRRLLAFLFCCIAGTSFSHAAAPPNILLIVADDLGAESSSLYKLAGSAGTAPMPNLEAIAARGLVFDNAWANPMCSPTRSTILTGLYGHRTGVLFAGDVLDPSTTTLFDYIRKSSTAKYEMAVFGKWHLGGNGGEIKHVMDMRIPNFRGFLGAQISDFFKWTAWDGNTGKSEEITTYSTTALTDWAIDFIKKHEATRAQDPWFVYVPYNAPHAPFQAPPKDLHTVNLGDLKPGDRKTEVAVYQAMVQAMDTEMGRLLKAVDLNKTLVIFMGDNGTPDNVKDGSTGVRGSKMATYEGGARVPLVIAGAGVTRTGRESALVNGVDLYATIAAAAGIPVMQVNDSHSLAPLLTTANAATGRKYSFTEFCTARASRLAIRDIQYKLHFDTASKWSLFDLNKDPLEANNLHDQAAYANVQKKLHAELDRLKAGAPKGCFQ
jgi:arylsulfatase A-like enzyme